MRPSPRRSEPLFICPLSSSRSQAPQQGRGGSTAFGSFQFVVKQVCQEPASLFSGSNSFMNLPQVTELLGGDKEKFNIPEDASKTAVVCV